eukprot:8656994-Alexandrium_andersonii.AAC.1
MEPPSDPPRRLQSSPLPRQIRNLRERPRRTQPSGASGINAEAVSGPAQLSLRTPEAVLHARQFKLRTR